MYLSKNLDHLGLVAGMCDQLELVSQIDALLPCDSEERKISTRTCVKALLLNGLGFVESPLYLAFFQTSLWNIFWEEASGKICSMMTV